MIQFLAVVASNVPVFGGSAIEDASFGPFLLFGAICLAVVAAGRFISREGPIL